MRIIIPLIPIHISKLAPQKCAGFEVLALKRKCKRCNNFSVFWNIALARPEDFFLHLPGYVMLYSRNCLSLLSIVMNYRPTSMY